MNDALQPLQLELFDELPIAPRLPRRLRRLGFALQRVHDVIALIEERHIELSDIFVEFVKASIDAAEAGRALPYNSERVASKIDDTREELNWMEKYARGLDRELERQLANGVERLLAK